LYANLQIFDLNQTAVVQVLVIKANFIPNPDSDQQGNSDAGMQVAPGDLETVF